MIHSSEVMDCQDLVTDLDCIAEYLRSDYIFDDINAFDVMADDLNKAADKLTNLVERLRLQ